MDEAAEYFGLLIGQQLHVVVVVVVFATSHVALRYEQTRKTLPCGFNVHYIKNHPRQTEKLL